ncbi:MAG: hypothetical protein KAT34_02250 [Candidatus Aminicenantes bacterium]|nr:hypothetical protein [Candidatus Aminicenantes bacterium]
MKQAEIGEKIEKLHEIFIGARNKVIADFKDKEIKWDKYIAGMISEKKNAKQEYDLILPYIYAFEIIMAPVGYLNALSEKEKIKTEKLKPYLCSNVFKDADFKEVCLKLYKLIYSDKFSNMLVTCSYDIYKPFPYGDTWSYDSMTWAFAFTVDALDLLPFTEKKDDYSDLIFDLQEFMKEFFDPKEIKSDTGKDSKEDGDLSIIGYYFSPEKLTPLNKVISTSEYGKDIIAAIKENIESRLIFALSNSSILSAYNLVCESIKNIKDINDIYRNISQKLFSLTASILAETEKFRTIKEPDNFKEMYYHIFNFGILVSISGFQGYEQIDKDSINYFSKIIDTFIRKIKKNESFRKTLPVVIPIPNKKSKELDVTGEPEFELNIAFPILIRSIATLLNSARAGKVEIETNIFESYLNKSIDLFIDYYMSKKETGIFMMPGEKDFELALTNSAVEALTLSMGYYIGRWSDLGGDEKGEGIPAEELKEFKKWKEAEKSEEYKEFITWRETEKKGGDEEFETWKKFKSQLLQEFDKRIDSRLTDRMDRIIETKMKDTRIRDPKFTPQVWALHKFLDIFEGIDKIKNDEVQVFSHLWKAILACTKALVTIDDPGNEFYKQIEKKAEDAVKIFLNPAGGQNRGDLLDKIKVKIIELERKSKP